MNKSFHSCSSFFKGLLVYYAILQGLHLIMNIVIVFFDQSLLLQVSSLLQQSDAYLFLITSYIDLFIASPLGVIGVVAIIKRKQYGWTLLSISIVTALMSMALYIGFLVNLGIFRLDTITVIFGVLFLPVVIIMGILLNHYIKVDI